MNKNMLFKEESIIEYRCLIWWISLYFSNHLLIISKTWHTRKYISKKIKQKFENVIVLTQFLTQSHLVPYWNTLRNTKKTAVFVHFSFCWFKNIVKYFKKFWDSEFNILYVENHGYWDYSCTFSDWLDQNFMIFHKKLGFSFFSDISVYLMKPWKYYWSHEKISALRGNSSREIVDYWFSHLFQFFCTI